MYNENTHSRPYDPSGLQLSLGSGHNGSLRGRQTIITSPALHTAQILFKGAAYLYSATNAVEVGAATFPDFQMRCGNSHHCCDHRFHAYFILTRSNKWKRVIEEVFLGWKFIVGI